MQAEAGFLTQKQWFRPRLFHVGIGVYKVTLAQVSALALPFSPVNYHSINAAWSSINKSYYNRPV
jgi:hypothetical protein